MPAASNDAPLQPLWNTRLAPPEPLRPLLQQVTDDIAALVFQRPLADGLDRTTREYAIALRQLIGLHGVGPLLGLRVEAGATVLDAALGAWLLEELAINRDRLARTRDLLDAVLAQLERREITAIPLKGAALLLAGREQIAWRVQGDIDLLVGDAPTREQDLAVAYAGYCLRSSTWKHRVYAACTPTPWDWRVLGESRDFPIGLELHPAVEEYFRGFRWDITPLLRAGLVPLGGQQVPGAQAMALHLCVHASINVLENFGRMLQLVDLQRALERSGSEKLLTSVRVAGPAYHARFLYPAAALTARETGSRPAAEIAEALAPHVPPGMRRWAEQTSLYDLSYPGRISRPAGDRAALWATSPHDRARMLTATLFPTPSILASEGYAGESALAVAGWYPRYYAGLARRVGRRKRSP